MNSLLSHGFWEVFKITGGLITSVAKTSPEVCQRQKWINLNIGVRSDSLKCGVPAHVIVFLKNIAGFLYLDLLEEPPKRSKSAIDSPNIGFPRGKQKKNIFSKSKYTKLFGFVNQECWTATYWRNLCVARDQTQTPPMTPLAQENHTRLFQNVALRCIVMW